MDIKINENYKVINDNRQYMLQERNKIEHGERQGEWSNFTTVAYFSNLNQLLKRCRDTMLINSEVETLEAMAEEVDKISNTIDRTLAEIKKEGVKF